MLKREWRWGAVEERMEVGSSLGGDGGGEVMRR